MPEFLFYSSLYYEESTLAKQQNVSVIESFKAQLMWFHSMSSINLPRTWDWIPFDFLTVKQKQMST